MTTVQHFYFNEDEVHDSVSAAGGPNNWHLAFSPHSDDGLHLEIATLDRKTFKALIEQIAEIGATILEAGESKEFVKEPTWTEDEIATLRVDFEKFARDRKVSPEVFAIVCPWATY